MRLSIRNPEADALAKRLAKLDDTTITDAVIAAMKEAIAARLRRKARPKPPADTGGHGLSFPANRRPVPPGAYHELDHDLSEGD